jgi:hypothetical protein
MEIRLACIIRSVVHPVFNLLLDSLCIVFVLVIIYAAPRGECRRG